MVQFSQSVKFFRSSAVRDLMSVAIKPDVISFAGGMPGNELFPVSEMEELYAQLPLAEKQMAFQYGPTPGYPPLLDSLTDYLRRKGFPVDKNKLLITTGSLQAIYILTKIFIDPGNIIVTENPSFVGALSAFSSFQAALHSIPLRSDGIDCAMLESYLKSDEAQNVKFIYLTPNFHNPAGILYSRENRRKVAEIAGRFGVPVIEDDAYGELYFEKEMKELVTPLKVLYEDTCTICTVGSFSKIVGPGFRLGWMLVPPEIYKQAELCKQSIDACSPNFTQVLADAFLRSGKMEVYIEKLREIYRKRKNSMVAAIKRYFPEEVGWNDPQGGFYIWCSVPSSVNVIEVLQKCMEQGAIYVIGQTFDPDAKDTTHFRLSFSNTPEEKIEEGIRILGNVLKQSLKMEK
ncbi:MAG TPA: PLP-dependent aminotransferase family protein [Bacteroidota bacterium]|nr:PLP-dependent aminotransferase family protein [Bacteroidota bacterium]